MSSPPRDPARIPIILAVLGNYWREYPDMRLGQIIDNFCSLEDPYYYEDDDLLADLLADELMQQIGGWDG